MERPAEKKVYARPAIEEFGAVADLTATGRTRPGDDIKSGSQPSHGR